MRMMCMPTSIIIFVDGFFDGMRILIHRSNGFYTLPVWIDQRGLLVLLLLCLLILINNLDLLALFGKFLEELINTLLLHIGCSHDVLLLCLLSLN